MSGYREVINQPISQKPPNGGFFVPVQGRGGFGKSFLDIFVWLFDIIWLWKTTRRALGAGGGRQKAFG